MLQAVDAMLLLNSIIWEALRCKIFGKIVVDQHNSLDVTGALPCFSYRSINHINSMNMK